MKILAANWKSHKTITETKDFFAVLAERKAHILPSSVHMIICPSFPSLVIARDEMKKHEIPVALGAQDVSPFPEGAYTGEVAATQLQDLVEYIIIGHSERRDYFEELDHMIEMKVKQAKDAGLKVILCVQDEDATVYDGVDIVAYEPVSAIGTGNPDDPENVQRVLSALQSRYPSVTYLYGGSVNSNTIAQFLSINEIGGFLVGGASLDADSFLQLAELCDTKS